MAKESYKLRFWGVRGSVPTPAAENVGYGGNTSCLGLVLSDREHLILDCGTGIRLLGESLKSPRRRGPVRYNIFFSHYHLDHIEGLPFFHPLYDADSTIVFHGFNPEGKSIAETLRTLISPPYFPVRLDQVPARLEYVTLDGGEVSFGDLRVLSLPLNHPNGSLSYRLEHGDRRMVYATDHEHGNEATDAALVEFSKGVDYLVYDATYVPSEYELLRRGWGHSTWYAGILAARAAGVKKLVLFHHHPGHTDQELDAVLRIAREELPGVEIAREGMELPL